MKDLIDQPQNAPFYNIAADLTLEELKKLANQVLVEFSSIVKDLEGSESKDEEFMLEMTQLDTLLETKTSAITIMEDVHPKKEFRDYSSEFAVQISSEITNLKLNEKIYKKYKNDVDSSNLSPQAKENYSKIMEAYKRNGFDKSSEVREKVGNIQKRQAKLTTEFNKNIAENTPTVNFSEDQLEGCFEEFINSRVKENGEVELSLVSNVIMHVMQNCSVKETREEVRRLSLNYAKDLNWKVLPEFLNLSEELAKLVGYGSYAELSMEDKMIEDPERAYKFINELLASTKNRVEKEVAAINKYKNKVGDTTELTYGDLDYYSNQIATRLSDLGEETLKQYFPYTHVKQSILSTFEEMFSIKFVSNKKAKAWSKDVEVFNVEEGGKAIGTIYLDMHPRKGKYNHACHAGMINGVKSKQIPQSVLICNFNQPKGDDPGLQSLDEVSTFFHEFGHLIHFILGGQKVEWPDISGLSVQWDFVEAPSQLLEEVVMDSEVLKKLSKHILTNESITDEVIERVRQKESIFDKARLKGIGIARQAALSKQSLEIYTHPAVTNEDLTNIEHNSVKEAVGIYGDYYMLYEFGHLIGYYSNYYTYMWSLAIAKDLFTKFNKKNLLDREVAERYRKTILEPGGSKPAAELVKDFLGREWNMDAFRAYLKEGEELLEQI